MAEKTSPREASVDASTEGELASASCCARSCAAPSDFSLSFCECTFGVPADGGVTAQRFDGWVGPMYQAWLKSDRKPAYVVAA